MKTKRRVRATFFLKVVVLGASVGVFLVAFLVATSFPVRVGTAVFLALFWLIGIEGEALPMVIEHLATRRAARRTGPIDSLWYVDVDAEERRRREARDREVERFYTDTRDNPTLR